MAIPSLTLRTVKGSALTFSEADTNFQNLANAKVAVSAGGTTSNIALNGATGAPTAITIANSATVQATQTSGTITLTSNITPGPTFANSATVQAVVADGTVTLTSNITPGATFANSATVGTSVAGGTTTISLETTGTAGTYSGAITTDVYGRVTTGTNSLAGNVDGNGHNLQNIQFDTYRERTANIGVGSGTRTIDANVAPIQQFTANGNITINTNNLSNFLEGESVTVILRYTANNVILTSNLLYVGGNRTLSTTTGNVDALTIFYDGTSYLAAVARYY